MIDPTITFVRCPTVDEVSKKNKPINLFHVTRPVLGFDEYAGFPCINFDNIGLGGNITGVWHFETEEARNSVWAKLMKHFGYMLD